MHAPLAALRRRLFGALLALPLVALSLLSPAASATWSIVVVDTQTREVCVASATCVPNLDLKRYVPMMLVGVGGAAAQSQGDTTGNNRVFIRGRMELGFTPRWILQNLPSIDPQHQTRQYGIVTLEDHAMTWSGSGAGAAKHGINGNFVNQDGKLVRYAIQGNLLTGEIVVEAARHALVHTKGDLSKKVMAAMEAARAMGGDGRCSCSPGNPTGCGAPPDDFEKSAHVAFITLARLGDVDGSCSAVAGCANGQYFLDEQRITPAGGPDPVIALRGAYADWRDALVGRPDHLLSSAAPDAASLPADGLSQTTVTVQLIDIEGDPLMHGGAALNVEWTGAGPPVATPGPVADHGGGQYSFALTATTEAGEGTWNVVVDDGLGPVQLWPEVRLEVR